MGSKFYEVLCIEKKEFSPYGRHYTKPFLAGILQHSRRSPRLCHDWLQGRRIMLGLAVKSGTERGTRMIDSGVTADWQSRIGAENMRFVFTTSIHWIQPVSTGYIIA